MVKKCSFDFDDTLCGEKTGIPNPVMIELLHKHCAPGFYATTDSQDEAFFLDLDYLNYEEQNCTIKSDFNHNNLN